MTMFFLTDHSRNISVSCSSRQRHQKMTSTPHQPSRTPTQTGQMMVNCRQAVSCRASPERKSRREGWRSEAVGGLISGTMTREWLLLPQVPLRLPSITRLYFQRSTVPSSCGRTSRTNTFVPSLTCGCTFLSSDVVFWAACHLWEFRGSFPTVAVWGFLGMWWIKHKGKWARLGQVSLYNNWNHREIWKYS